MPTMQELARGLNGSCTSTNTQNDNNKTNRAPTMQELAKGTLTGCVQNTVNTSDSNCHKPTLEEIVKCQTKTVETKIYNDYNQLLNKPTINGNIIIGNIELSSIDNALIDRMFDDWS